MRAHSIGRVTSFVTERDGVRWRKILHLTGCKILHLTGCKILHLTGYDVSDAVRTPLALDISMSISGHLIFVEQSVLASKVGWDSSVGIATRCRLDGPGIESHWEAKFSAPVQTGPGVHPFSYTVGTGSFPGVKRPGRGVDHSTLPLGVRGLL
jgi:hypothetical protein